MQNQRLDPPMPDNEVHLHLENTLDFGDYSVEAGCFDHHGKYFVTATKDGFIELWDWRSGNALKDIVFVMDHGVSALALDPSDKYLASGSVTGNVCVWNLETGSQVAAVSTVYQGRITCLLFSKGVVLSTGCDKVVKAVGICSQRILREFRGHKSVVNAILCADDQSVLVSGSSDGTIRLWDLGSAQCLSVIIPKIGTQNQLISRPVIKLLWITCQEYVVQLQPDTILVMDINGKTLSTWTSGSIDGCWNGGKYYTITPASLECTDLQTKQTTTVCEFPGRCLIRIYGNPKECILAVQDSSNIIQMLRILS